MIFASCLNYKKWNHKEKIVKSIIGKKVEVIIDRQIGSSHPEYPDMIYPINYGYIPGIFGGDGEEQDAYIMGVDKPIEHFSGVVIAEVVRKNDNETKLVVAPEGLSFSEEEILSAVNFQEKYFDYLIII